MSIFNLWAPRNKLSLTPIELHGKLRVVGRSVVDETNSIVILRGVSLFWSQWQPQFFNLKALRWLRDDWRVHVVRIPLGVRPNGYIRHPSREILTICQAIDACVELGLYVVVDWHTHDLECLKARSFFSSIAREYGALPNLIYELWNEPTDQYSWQEIKTYHETVLLELRSLGVTNMAVVGTPNWSRDVHIAAVNPLCDTNVAYALHFYAATHRQPLRERAMIARRFDLPLFVTEWGTCSANGDGNIDLPEVRRWWRFLERNQISYISWSISDRSEGSAALKSGALPTGEWRRSALTKSGRLVRNHIRKMNSIPRFF
jgi:endoglucanase